MAKTPPAAEFRSFEDLAAKKSPVHRIHPLAKLLVILAFVIIVTSFGRYSVTGMLPLAAFPLLLIIFSDIPLGFFIKKLVLILPLIILIGIFNPIFDREMIPVGAIEIPRGFVTLLSLTLKGSLTVTAAMLLAATTGIEKIALSLRMLFLPKIFVLQVLLTYRYISVLLGEVSRIALAYHLRAPSHRGIHIKAWGTLTGQLLLRSFDKADKVYTAMRLRGFDGEYNTGSAPSVKFSDIAFLILCAGLFVIIRIVNLPEMIGGVFI